MRAELRAWWRREDDATRVALVVIMLAAVAARAWALGRPMRYDESVTYLHFIGQPWRTAVGAYQIPNNHVLYTAMAKLAVALGGNAPWVLRLPAFAAGLAIVPLTYAVGRALYSPAAALIGAALAAASNELILYSGNARGYTFVIAAFLGLLLAAERIREQGGTWRRWTVFALLAAGGLATIPVMLYPLGAAALWFALTAIVERGRHAVRALAQLAAALVGAAALTLLAYVPVIRVSGLRALVANRYVTASPWPQFFHDLYPRLLSTLAAWAEPYPWILALLFGAAVAFGIARRGRASRAAVSPLLAAFVWWAVLLLATHRLPFTRIWLWMLPLVALAAGTAAELALSAARTAVVRAAAPAAAGALALFGVAWGFAHDALGRNTDTGAFEAAAPLTRVLMNVVQPGDRIVAVAPANAPLRYYMLRAGADTALLSTPDSIAERDIIVLAVRFGQTIPQTIEQGLVDTARFGPIAPAIHLVDADVYVAERKGSQP